MTTVRTTNHWRGIAGLALVVGGLGVLANRPSILLATCVVVGFAVYSRLQGEPPVELAVERWMSDTNPAPGDDVTVTVAVSNQSDRFLPDVRLVDGVPAMLSVVDGAARTATTLRPGGTETFSYTVGAERGTHRFQPVTAIVRNLSGAIEVETTVGDDGDAIECEATVADPPVGDDTDPYPGRVLTDDAGEGVEFAHLREYRPGDAPNRIDWNQLARTGALATVEFRQEQTVSVVACIDARPAAYVGQPDRPHAVAHGIVAARKLLQSVWDVDERAGLAAIGREFCWLAPGRGAAYESRLERLLCSHRTLSPVPPSDPLPSDELDAQVTEFRARLGSNTQVVFVTPLADGLPVDLTLEFAAAGRSMAVLSPDVTRSDSPGGRVAAVERDTRISRLRQAGVRVIDWQPTTPLAQAMLGATERWSR